MKNSKMRLTALLVALMMLLGLVPALAESPAETPMAAFLKSGKNIKTEFTLEVNPMLGGLIVNLTGGQADEATMNTINTIVNAVNKLKGTFVMSQTGVSGVYGTETGNLMDMQASFEEDGSNIKMTSSMLPGLYATVDPEFIAKFAGQMNTQAMNQEQMQKLVLPYLAVVQGEVAKVQQAAPAEEGSFETPHGTFTKQTKLPVTSHMLAGLVVKLGEVYAQDEAAQQFIKEMNQANQSMNQSMDIPSQDAPAAEGSLPPAEGVQIAPPSEDPIKDLVTSAQEALGREDSTLFNLTAYENDAKVFLNLETLPEDPQQTNVQVLADKADLTTAKESNFEVKMLMGGPKALGEDGNPVVETTDWVALEQSILSGENYSATLVNLSVKANNVSETHGTSNVNVSLMAGGMNLGIAVDTDADLATMVSTTKVALSVMMPDPLLVVTVTSNPTEEAPVAPVTEGAKEVVLREEISEEDQKLVEEAMGNVGAALLQKLNAALPEEAPAIIKLIQDSMAAPSPDAETIPEPVLEPETEGGAESGVETETEVETEAEGGK